MTPAPYRVMLPPVSSRLGILGDAAADAQTFKTISNGVSSVGITALGAWAATAAAAGAPIAILGMSAAVAVPVIGAALAGVSMIVSYLIANSGCGPTCVETSQWANQIEPYLVQNIKSYFALPAPRSATAQAAALATFDSAWAQLQKLCSQPGTGDAGKRCISDRQAGACTWRQTTTSPLLAYPGEPQPNECWNWVSGYRDPIANDTQVVDDSSAAPVGSSSSTGTSTSSNSMLYLAGAAAILLLAFGGKN